MHSLRVIKAKKVFSDSFPKSLLWDIDKSLTDLPAYVV